MSYCDECFKSVRHEGIPTGKIEKLNGVDTYIALPKKEYPKDQALLYIPDAFGMQFVNAQLLADDFARNGFATYLPDYLNGDPVPPGATQTRDFDVQGWLSRHGSDKMRPPLDAVIKGLRELGITTFAATGYCMGARYLFDLAFEHKIKVSVVSHPSLLKTEDFIKYGLTCTAPLLVNSCEIDGQFPIEAQARADQALGNGRFSPGYSRTYFKGCKHGFAVRGDMSDPQVKAGKEEAFRATVEWLHKHLPGYDMEPMVARL